MAQLSFPFHSNWITLHYSALTAWSSPVYTIMDGPRLPPLPLAAINASVVAVANMGDDEKGKGRMQDSDGNAIQQGHDDDPEEALLREIASKKARIVHGFPLASMTGVAGGEGWWARGTSAWLLMSGIYRRPCASSNQTHAAALPRPPLQLPLHSWRYPILRPGSPVCSLRKGDAGSRPAYFIDSASRLVPGGAVTPIYHLPRHPQTRYCSAQQEHGWPVGVSAVFLYS